MFGRVMAILGGWAMWLCCGSLFLVHRQQKKIAGKTNSKETSTIAFFSECNSGKKDRIISEHKPL